MGTPFSHDLGEGIVSPEAIAEPPPFERLRAVVLYNDLAKRLVSGLKFHDRLDLAAFMAGWMARAGEELLADNPVIVPVPLYSARLIARRFNQSAELAKHVAARSTGLDRYRPDLVARYRATRQQVGLSQSQRRRNVSGAFRPTRNGQLELQGARVLVIDDVYTTGATVKAVSRCLRRAGAAQIDVLVFASVYNQ